MSSSTDARKLPTISVEGRAALDALLADRVGSDVCPATTFGATTAQGPIYFATRGQRAHGEAGKGEIDDTTMLQLYSATKLVTTVAVLQLVDRGLVDLDDPELLEKTCPELWALQILTGFDDAGAPLYKPRLGYGFSSPLLARWEKDTGFGGHWAYDTTEGFQAPLVFEPGERWMYSVGIDWAGICVERVTGQNLETYFRENIFALLGLGERDITFIPSDDVRARLQTPCARTPDHSGLVQTDSLRPLDRDADTVGQLSGGGGLFGTAMAYLRFLQAVLASSQPGDSNLISPASFKELFTDSLPRRGTPSGDRAHADLAEMTTRQGYHDPNHTANSAQALGHSVGLVLSLSDSVYGRREGSGCWDGAAKTQY